MKKKIECLYMIWIDAKTNNKKYIGLLHKKNFDFNDCENLNQTDGYNILIRYWKKDIVNWEDSLSGLVIKRFGLINLIIH